MAILMQVGCADAQLLKWHTVVVELWFQNDHKNPKGKTDKIDWLNPQYCPILKTQKM